MAAESDAILQLKRGNHSRILASSALQRPVSCMSIPADDVYSIGTGTTGRPEKTLVGRWHNCTLFDDSTAKADAKVLLSSVWSAVVGRICGEEGWPHPGYRRTVDPDSWVADEGQQVHLSWQHELRVVGWALKRRSPIAWR